MARREKIPYPAGPDPDSIPDDLTEFPDSYVNQERLLLLAQLVFLLAYLVLVGLTGFLTVWLVMGIKGSGVLGVVGALFCGLMFLFLAKGLFRRTTATDVENAIEVTEDEQPLLFEFIRRICEETGAEEPRRVILDPSVNAGVRNQITIANLFVAPKKDLIIGLGLVNCVNLSEFKNVMAHEFGHFTQQNFYQAHGMIVGNVIVNLIQGQDLFDRMLNNMRTSPGGALLAGIIGIGPKIVSWCLMQIYRLLDFAHYELRREQEFHADLVGVSLVGSNAATHALLKTSFGFQTYNQALQDLIKAADHKLYTSDMYFHMHAASKIVRRKERDPNLGVPPTLNTPLEGKGIQVFDPEGDYEEQTSDGHPSVYEREENMKSRFVPCEIDERSPWLLFEEPAVLRERLTRKLYKSLEIKIPRGTELDEPRKVQKFIDDEHQETTYDPKYEGVYDERMLNPGDLDELNELIQKEPWTDDRLLMVHNKLYQDVKGRADDWLDLMKQRKGILDNSNGNITRKTKKLLREVDDKLEQMTDWHDSLDRRAYLVFVQMAYRVNNLYYYDLVNRYRFHMAVQGMYKSARHHQENAFISFHIIASQSQPDPEFFMDFMHTLRSARSALKKILREARELDMPAMKNFDEGDRLGDFLLNEDLISELPETYVKGKWIDKLMRQLDLVMSRSSRLHFKSLGGILRVQEEIAEKFLAGRQAR